MATVNKTSVRVVTRLIEIGKDGQLGGIIALGLQHIINCSNSQRGIQITIQSIHKAFFQLIEGFLIHFTLILEGCDLGDQLVVSSDRIIEIFPAEDQIAAVVAYRGSGSAD